MATEEQIKKTDSLKKVFALDGDKMGKVRMDYVRKGGNGFGVSEQEVGYTMNTVDQHMVAVCNVAGVKRFRACIGPDAI